jgi:predicted Holliday junction resolvase-like endonuclease
MKRLLITLMILGLTCSTTQAQSILRRLERTARTAAERAAERKVEEKVEEEVSKALDEALEESEKEKQEAIKTKKAVPLPAGLFKIRIWNSMTGIWKQKILK